MHTITSSIAPTKLHTIDEIAAIINRSGPATRRMIDRGKGPRHIKLGGRVVVLGADLISWIESAFAAREGIR